MPKLKRLSGLEVIDILCKFGFTVHSQKGSHVKLRRVGIDGNETLTIPNHRELDTGTCKAIFRQASQYISEAELHPCIYS